MGESIDVDEYVVLKSLDLAGSSLDRRRPWVATVHLLIAWDRLERIASPRLAGLASEFLALLVRKAIIETQQRRFRDRVHAEIDRVIDQMKRKP